MPANNPALLSGQTALVTGGGFPDHPITTRVTVSLGKAAVGSAATMLGANLEPDGIRVAKPTIAGQIVAAAASEEHGAPCNVGTMAAQPARELVCFVGRALFAVGVERNTERQQAL